MLVIACVHSFASLTADQRYYYCHRYRHRLRYLLLLRWPLFSLSYHLLLCCFCHSMQRLFMVFSLTSFLLQFFYLYFLFYAFTQFVCECVWHGPVRVWDGTYHIYDILSRNVTKFNVFYVYVDANVWVWIFFFLLFSGPDIIFEDIFCVFWIKSRDK